MGAFVKTMRFVGDLDDDFYDDERQRDVWNEASAIGFQLFYWAALVAAAVLPWFAGITGARIALGVLVVALVISCATIGYSAVRGVNIYTAAKLGRVRGVVAAVLYGAGAVGVLVRLQPGLYAEAGSQVGGLVGGVVGLATVGALIWLMRRRRDRFENEEL